MYNIDIYSYWKKPFSETKKFNIYPLDDKGRRKYYSNQSHNVHYLKRTDPFVFKSIIGIDYNTLLKEQDNKIREMKNETNLNDNINEDNVYQNQVNVNDNDNDNDNCDYKNDNNENYQTNFNNETKLMRKSQSQENINYKNLKPNNIYSENILEYIPFNPKNTTSKHFFKEYRKPKNFFGIFGYNKSLNFKNNGERYKYKIKKLLYKTRLTSNSQKNINFNQLEKPISDTFKNYTKNLSYSMEKYYKEGLNNEEIEKIENEKLNRNLMNQTSCKFRMKYKLPDVCSIANQKQKIRIVRNSNQKEMGEKYNPYAFIIPNKNRTARNYIGDLFKH